MSHPSSCIKLMNHRPPQSQQSCKEEHERWKWGATTRHHASHTKTMLSTWTSVPRSSRQSDHTKSQPPDHRKETQTEVVLTCLRSSGLAKTILQGTVKRGRRWSKQKKRLGDDIGNGLAWSLPSPRGQWRTKENGGNWLWSRLWCPNSLCSWVISEGEDEHSHRIILNTHTIKWGKQFMVLFERPEPRCWDRLICHLQDNCFCVSTCLKLCCIQESGINTIIWGLCSNLVAFYDWLVLVCWSCQPSWRGQQSCWDRLSLL